MPDQFSQANKPARLQRPYRGGASNPDHFRFPRHSGIRHRQVFADPPQVRFAEACAWAAVAVLIIAFLFFVLGLES